MQQYGFLPADTLPDLDIPITAADRARVRRECRRAAQIDPSLQQIIDRCGYPEPRQRGADFATLLQVIISQQLSTKAAAAIGRKVRRECGGKITWRRILNRSDTALRDCGLSTRKIEYAKGLARMIQRRDLVIEDLGELPPEDVIDELVKIRGFGRWSGEIFAMFAFGHRDIYPADDLALQIAVQRHLGLKEKPSGRQTAEIAARWSPHRSAVALLMWKFYGATTLQE